MVKENLERMISSHQRQKELPQQPPIIQVRQPVSQSVSIPSGCISGRPAEQLGHRVILAKNGLASRKMHFAGK